MALLLDTLAVPGEHLLSLRDGRRMAFSSGGDLASKKIFIGLHGVFGVGEMTPHMSASLCAMGWRGLAPTLPGWGRSDPFREGVLVCSYASDIQELLASEVGTAEAAPTHIIVMGGSYGSIFAHAVAANSPSLIHTRIEPASAIRGLLILGGFSPYNVDAGYAAACNGMSFFNWITVGRPGQYWPLSLLHPFLGSVMSSKLRAGEPAALEILRMILTGPNAMKEEERRDIAAWAERVGTNFSAWEAGMARNMVLSVRDSMEGYRACPRIINSDWGFRLGDLRLPGAPLRSAAGDRRAVISVAGEADIPPMLPPVVIVGALRDHLAPIAMSRYVAAVIPGAQLIELQGNHIAAIMTLLPIVKAMVAGVESSR